MAQAKFRVYVQFASKAQTASVYGVQSRPQSLTLEVSGDYLSHGDAIVEANSFIVTNFSSTLAEEVDSFSVHKA